jgi:DUF4097 and DUF4098 domain-containing protein YvlB
MLLGQASRTAILLIVTAAVAGILGACQITGTVVASDVVEERLTVERAPRVTVETFNGRIGVVAGGDTSIELRVTKRGSGISQADAERDLREVRVDVTQEEDRVTIAVRRNDDAISLGNSGADIEIAVPVDSSLELRTSNGRIESANVDGPIVARSSNASMTIRGGVDIDAETSNGSLTVNAATGRLELRTSNASLDVIGATDAVVSAETSNGALTFSGSLAEGGHRFRTSNADLSLQLPPDASFLIEGRTSNATVSTTFADLEVTQDALSGSVGEDAESRAILATTSNGDLSVTARP